MERIGVRELRQHASRYLHRVEQGETVEVTQRGRPVARLVPLDRAATERERLIATGRLRPASRPFALPDRVPLPPGVPDTATILDELREDRR
jgi:prevent-host-death family protein